jgi:hypothetical protein
MEIVLVIITHLMLTGYNQVQYVVTYGLSIERIQVLARLLKSNQNGVRTHTTPFVKNP